MDREQALSALTECAKSDYPDEAHRDADEVLCKLLISLGYEEVVDLWQKIEKWYA